MSVSRQVRRHMERQAARNPQASHTGASPSMIGRQSSGIQADTPGKGNFDGNCNRTACQAPLAGTNWFNTSTRQYYCTACARLLNHESRRFDGIDVCVHVRTAEERAPFPYEETVRFRAEREARRDQASMVA